LEDRPLSFSRILRVAGLAISAGSFLLSTPLAAKDLNMEDLKRIQEKVKGFDTLSVDFDQETYSHLRGKSVKGVGKAVFVQPGKFRWQLLKPTADEWIFDGKTVVNYKPDEKLASRYASDGSKAREISQIADSVMNLDALLKRYDVIKATQDGDLVKVDLKPKTIGEITAMQLHLKPKEGFVSFLKLHYDNKNTLGVTFKNPSRQAVPASAFELPKGVKVTDIK
jgi:outer membrane lipoprotein-sorting protein